MSGDRSWPNENHYQVLQDGSLAQLENLYAFLPAVQTEDQDYYMRQLAAKLRTFWRTLD